MVERLVEGEGVGGSIPSLATKKLTYIQDVIQYELKNAAITQLYRVIGFYPIGRGLESL